MYPNDKPWITRQLKSTMREEREAFNDDDKERVREMNGRLQNEIAGAKRKYKDYKLESCFEANNPRGAWKCLEIMTHYSQK